MRKSSLHHDFVSFKNTSFRFSQTSPMNFSQSYFSSRINNFNVWCNRSDQKRNLLAPKSSFATNVFLFLRPGSGGEPILIRTSPRYFERLKIQPSNGSITEQWKLTIKYSHQVGRDVTSTQNSATDNNSDVGNLLHLTGNPSASKTLHLHPLPSRPARNKFTQKTCPAPMEKGCERVEWRHKICNFFYCAQQNSSDFRIFLVVKAARVAVWWGCDCPNDHLQIAFRRNGIWSLTQINCALLGRALKKGFACVFYGDGNFSYNCRTICYDLCLCLL